MPELPEVETVARQLSASVLGHTVRRLRIVDPLLRVGRTPRLGGAEIVEVGRSGKRVLIGMDRPGGESLWLAVHLRMTGRLIWSPGSTGRSAHLRAWFELDRGRLLFIDTRRFGTFNWYDKLEATRPGGLDPLSPELTPGRMAQLLRGSRQNMKAWLLRQDRLVGLGNIYASEILHAARIAPSREAATLDRREAEAVRRATRRILLRAIRHCGTTFSDFQDSRGVEGAYQQYLAVYAREGLPCRRCREPVLRVVQQQRSTFYCGSCQR